MPIHDHVDRNELVIGPQPTGAQVLDWIEQNTDQHLSHWQRQMVTGVFDSGFSRIVVSTPHRYGHTNFAKTIEQAVTALSRAE